MALWGESLEAQARRETASIQCPCCKQQKESGKPFCRKCFMELPEDSRYGLATRSGLDFAVIQDESKERLRAGVRWKA